MLKLPKRKILRQKQEFQKVYRYGRSFANRYVVLYVFTANGLEDKVGFAAGKKAWQCGDPQSCQAAAP